MKNNMSEQTEQIMQLLYALHENGALEDDEYMLIRDNVYSLESKYKKAKKELIFVRDRLRTECNYLEQAIIRHGCAIEDIEEVLNGTGEIT